MTRTVVALALITLGAGAYLHTRPTAPKPSAAVISDTSGQILKVVCTANSARRAALRNADIISRVVNTLPEHAQVLILTNDRDAFSIASNPWKDRVQFVSLPGEARFTIWPQDPFVVLAEPGTAPRLLVSRRFERADDRLIAEHLATHLGASWQMSSLGFEGGNIVVDDRSVFVGANTIARNAAELDETVDQVINRFHHEFGKRVVMVGPAPQPIGHIDMMLTPTGDNTLVLADPGAGAEIAESVLREDPDGVLAFETACEQQFFGDAAITQLTLTDGTHLEAPDVRGLTARAIEDSRDIQPQLDRLAQDLAKLGYKVKRMPLLYSRPEIPQQETAEPLMPLPGYPLLTYNNVLMERGDDRRIVYLPSYGFAALDEAAARSWGDAGWTVRVVEGLAISAMYGGSLRCCIKVLERSER